MARQVTVKDQLFEQIVSRTDHAGRVIDALTTLEDFKILSLTKFFKIRWIMGWDFYRIENVWHTSGRPNPKDYYQ